MASPPRNTSLISNSEEAAMQTNPVSSLKDRVRCQPHLSQRLKQAGVQVLQSTHSSTMITNRTDWRPDGCIRSCDQDRARAESKIQSRISDRNQTRPVESCSVGPTICCQDQVHSDIPIKIRRFASAVGPGAREELRRFLASSDSESSIEERIRSLERENAEMLLEVWRSKLEFARAKRELRSEWFRLKMQKILEKIKL